MDILNFYKSLFDREQIRKIELDNSTNVPIAIITIIFTILSVIIKETHLNLCNPITYNLILIFIFLIVSIYFLTCSYNNLFKGFDYGNLPNTLELYNHQINLESYNKVASESEIETFENYLIKNYAELTDTNLKINRERLLNLYKAKTYLILSIILTSLLISIYFLTKFHIYE